MKNLTRSGPFWMTLAGFSFAIMGVFVKLGSNLFSTGELVFYRCAVGLIGIAVVILPQGKSLRVSKSMLKLHLSRSISGFISLMLYFYAISQLPLATAVTLSYTSPLFFIIAMTIQQKRRPQSNQLGGILLGFAGVLLLLRPTLDSHQWMPALLGLLAGFLAGVAYINVNELGKAGEPEWRTVFYFSLVCTLGAGIWMLASPASIHIPDLRGLGIIAGLGLAATIAQLCMTRAYRGGKSLTVVSLAYLTVVFSSIWGWLLWGYAPGTLASLGMLLIILAGIWASAPRLQRA